MKIVICGLGEVGSYVADLLVKQGHELVLIDQDPERTTLAEEQLDATVITGSGTLVSILKAAQVEQADFFLSVTSKDEVNIVSASLAKAMGAKRVMARCHAFSHREHKQFSYARHFKIDYFIQPDRLAAAQLAKEIRNPLSPVLDQFARGMIEVSQVTIEKDAHVVGKNLVQIPLPPRMRVGLMKRGGEVTIPSAQTELKEGDQLILIGTLEAVKSAVEILSGNTSGKQPLKLVLYGAEDVGTSLLEYFSPMEAGIKLIDPDLERCQQISELYPWVRVVHGEAINSRLLLEENVMDADVFVAATRDDENNVMSCLQAVKLAVRPCLLTIHRPDYAGILMDIGELLGINATVSPRLVTGEEILRYVTEEPYFVLWELPGKAAQIIEIRLQAKASELFGKKIREISWPQGVLLLGIERSDQIIVPTAEDTIQSEDSLFLLTLRSEREHLLDLFRGSL